MKKGKGQVNRFAGPDGKHYFPGDIVDLPASYLGLAWLEPLEKPGKAEVPPAKIEPAPTTVFAPATEENTESPLPEKKGKKSKS